MVIDSELLPTWRQAMRAKAKALHIKGTILLSAQDGINLFVAGEPLQLEEFKQYICSYPEIGKLHFKDSESTDRPFSRMLVKIKNETIAFGVDQVIPHKKTAPYVSPEQLQQWYENNKEMVVLDTRNDYEIALGSFDNAIDLNIKSFRDFPEAVKNLPQTIKDKPVVTFCTGGIRCEKAAEYMLQLGFKEVYQLHGGILNYFDKCQEKHYHGECFVFDKRVAVDHTLKETATKQCYACRMPLTPEKQEGLKQCPFCKGNPYMGKRARTKQQGYVGESAK